MCVMENLVLFLDCSGQYVYQGAEQIPLFRWYFWASKVPSHHMVTGTSRVFTEPGLAQRVGLERVPARKSEAGFQDNPLRPQISSSIPYRHPCISHTCCSPSPTTHGLPLDPSEEDGSGKAGEKLISLHSGPRVQTQIWKRVPLRSLSLKPEQLLSFPGPPEPWSPMASAAFCDSGFLQPGSIAKTSLAPGSPEPYVFKGI
jgi:hypothetical protein